MNAIKISQVTEVSVPEPFKRIVKVLASPKSMVVPGANKPVKGPIITEALTAGVSLIPLDGGLSPHIHEDEEEIIYIISGKGEYTIGDKSYKVESEEILYIPPKVQHFMKNIGNETLVQFWVSTKTQ